MRRQNAAILNLAFAACAAAFSPSPVSLTATKPNTQLGMLPLESTSMSVAMNADLGEMAKAIVITLAFGGGLIPATIAGNKAMFETLAGKRRGGEEELGEDFDPSTSFDPTIMDQKNRAYVESSGATGPTLPGSTFLLPNEPIPLVDVIAVIGRISDVNSLADWANLPSTRLAKVSANPPMWLPRGAFKVNVRTANSFVWPTDPKTGEPIGGEELKRAEEGRISKKGALIGDAALDAVWDSWAWGASVTTPEKVALALRDYHPSVETFELSNFVGAAIRGRSITGLAALTFIAIQLIAYGSLFIAPALRAFFDIDIGFGTLGDCDPNKCLDLSLF